MIARIEKRTVGLAIALAALWLLPACGPDDPVGGDDVQACVGDACPADADAGEVSGDVAVERSLDFHVETKDGNVLEGGVTTAKIAHTADVDPLQDGVQVHVVVTTTNVPVGTPVEVLVNGAVVAGPVNVGADGSARFDAVDVPCVSTPMSLGVRAKVAGEADVQAAKNLEVDCGQGCTAVLEPVGGCLVTDVDKLTPGFQHTFVVKTTTTDCSHAFLEFTDTAGKADTSAKVPLSGLAQASVTVTLSPDDKGLEGALAKVKAKVEDQAHPERPVGESPELQVVLTTEAPVLTVLQPQPGQLTLKDDADAATPGIQTTLVGTATTITTADIDQIQLSIDGGAPISTTLQVDNTFQFPLSFAESKTYTLKITATNGCGLTGSSKPLPYSVFASKAAMVVQSPAPGQVLFAKDDGDPATTTIYETDVVVGTQSATQGSEISVFCKKTGLGNAYGDQPVGTAVVQDPTATSLAVPVTLDVDLLSTGVDCFARDNAPNPSQSSEVSFQIGLPPPCMDVVLPFGPVTVNTGSLDVVLGAENLDGVEVQATLSGQGGAFSDVIAIGKVSGGALVTQVALQTGSPAQLLPDGTYSLTFDAVDKFGNHAADQGCSDVQRTVTIDTQGPELTVSLPAKATLTATEDLDSDPTSPGYQTDVQITAVDAETVCLTVNGGELGCKPAGPGSVQVLFQNVTLQPGLNGIAPSGTDVFGNESKPQATQITLVSDVPVVLFVDKASLVTISDKMTLKAQVLDNKGAPLTGVLTEVLINGKVDPAVVVVDNGDGTYSLEVKNLSAGVTTVQLGAAAVADPTKKGYSSPVTITYKAVKPTATLTSPGDGSVFNLASTACIAGVPDCLTKVTAVTTDAENTSLAVLTAVCGGKKLTYGAKVTNNAVSFNNVGLLNGSKCQLGLTVTDLAGQVATAKSVEVTVDRTAPVFGLLVSPLKQTAQITLLASDDVNGDPSDNLQINVQIQAKGLPKGANVQLDVIDDAGKKTTFACKDVPEIPDTSVGTVSCGVVTVPDGFKIKLVFTAADAAGNPATKTITAQVLSSKPEVRITNPPDVVKKGCAVSADCGTAGVCAAGTCALPWNKLSNKTLSVFTFGMPNGAALRVCSDAPGLTGEACATPGFKVVGTGTVSQSLGDVSLAGLADGTYDLIAEASFLPSVPWTASLASTNAVGQRRTILLDTVAPEIAAIAPPAPAGVPAGCLSDKAQSSPDLGLPGGKFTFAVTTVNEDATVSLLVQNLKAASGPTTAKAANLTVTIAAEGTTAIAAAAVDLVGNVGATKSIDALQVNTVAPSGSFAVPNKAKLLANDGLDVKVVSSATDVEGQDVVLKDAGAAKGIVKMTSGVATFPHATYNVLSDGEHQLQATLTDACGNSATAATVPAKVVVDTSPPQVNIVSPAQGAQFGDQDDASTKGGYQIEVEFGTVDAVSWSLELGQDCDATFANCASFQAAGSGSVTAPGANEPKVVVTVPFGSTANYLLRLTAIDGNGNQAQFERGFQVQLTGCLVQLKGLPATGGFNTQACAVPGLNCASVAAQLTAEFVGPCGAVTAVQLLKGGQQVASKAPVDGAASFDVTFADGDDTEVEAIVLAGTTPQGSSGALKVSADLTHPVLAFVAGQVAGTPALSGAAPSLLALAQDLDPAAGHQAHALLQVQDAGLEGGALVSLVRVVDGAEAPLPQDSVKLPLALTDKAVELPIVLLTLLENKQNTVKAKVQDAAGNVAEAQLVATVDWVAPAAVTLKPFAASDLNPRRPLARLTFTAVGDNGVSGTAAKYLVRYSRKAIANQADFDAACDAAALPLFQAVTPAAAGADEQVFVEGPDPRPAADPCKYAPAVDNAATQYHFAVQVADAAGNKSPISAAASTTALRLRYAKINLVAPYDHADFKARVNAVGDLNGDGLGDFTLGGGEKADLCVLYGRAAGADGVLPDLTLDSASGPNHVCLTNAGGLGAPTARSADVNGDGVQDLVVANGAGTGVLREARAYLGKKNGKIGTTPAAVIKGIANGLAFGGRRLGTIGNFNGDKSPAGNPVADIVVQSAASGAITYDRVFVIPGSTKWVDGATVTIDLNNATDRATHHVLTLHLADSSGLPYFGWQVGGVGNLIPDAGTTQYDELAIAQYSSPQQLFIVKGRPLAGDKTIQFSSNGATGTGDNEAVRVRAAGETGVNSFAAFFDTVSFDGDAVPDLVLQHQPAAIEGALYWIRGSAIAKAAMGSLLSMNGVPVPGETGVVQSDHGYFARTWLTGVQAIGNFADQTGQGALVDVAYGRPANAPDGGSNRVVVRHAVLRPQSGVPGEPSYLYEDLVIGDPFSPGNTTWGVTKNTGWGGISFAGVGDFTSDGLPDLVIGSAGASLVVVY